MEVSGSNQVSTPKRILVFFLVTALGCANSILITISKNDENSYNYDISSVPTCTEMVKLAMSMLLLVRDGWWDTPSIVSATLKSINLVYKSISWQLFALATIYVLQNILVFYILLYIDPGTYQILTNLRIPIVALMMHFFLRKRYTGSQIIGISMLSLGAILYSAGKANYNFAYSKTEQVATDYSEITGCFLTLAMVICSSAAGVFNEYCLKQGLSHQSVGLQNTQLYLFGFIINCVVLQIRQNIFNIFHGFDAITIGIISNSAFLGISVGYITKYCDTNLRIFGSIVSILLSSLYSSIFMAVSVSKFYGLSLALTCVGIFLYTWPFP